MELSQTGKDLINELKKISNNKEFIGGVMSILEVEEKWKKMLDFIVMSYNEEDKLTTDDILKLALIFNNE